jgi:hypothetical protein
MSLGEKYVNKNEERERFCLYLVFAFATFKNRVTPKLEKQSIDVTKKESKILTF